MNIFKLFIFWLFQHKNCPHSEGDIGMFWDILFSTLITYCSLDRLFCFLFIIYSSLMLDIKRNIPCSELRSHPQLWKYTLKPTRIFRIQSQGASPNYGGIFLAGCVGGAVQLSIACPVELIKGGNHYLHSSLINCLPLGAHKKR